MQRLELEGVSFFFSLCFFSSPLFKSWILKSRIMNVLIVIVWVQYSIAVLATTHYCTDIYVDL